MRQIWTCSISILLVAASAPSAYAQTDEAESLQLEEIVVTAEKREQNLQKVSASIQVKSGEELRLSGKRRIDEMMEGTVGIQAQGSPTGTAFFIRGVQPAEAARGTPVTTPIIIDGVAQNRTESVRGGSLDVAQVEVMRGPQSTNLGANSLSGAISLVSNKPVFDFQGNGSLEVGNYDKVSTEGVLNLPLTDNQALRLAYANDKRDGYYSNGSGETDTVNTRLKYRFQVSEDLDVLATVARQKIGGLGSELGLRATGAWTPFTSTLAASTTFSSGCNVSSLPTGYSAYLGCPVSYLLQDNGTTFRQRSDAWDDGLPMAGWGYTSYQDSTIDQANVQITWITGIGTLTVQPSFQRSHFKSLESPMSLSGNSFNQEDIRENTSTLEARIDSSDDTLLKWQAGLRYNVDDYGFNTFTNISAPGSVLDPVSGTICGATIWCYAYRITPDQKATGRSVYANSEFSVTDSLRLAAGLRYNRDSASVTELNGTINGDVNGYNAAELATATYTHGKKTWSKLTYRTGIEWDANSDTMLYAVYSTGYTPGAVTGMTPGGTDPVTLKQISAGWKSEWLDNRLQWNGEFFHSRYFNRTVTLASTSSYVLNGGDIASCGNTNGATNYGGFYFVSDANGSTSDVCVIPASVQAPEILSKGLDMDLTFLISSNDRLTATLEWMDTTYSKRPVINGIDSGSATSLQTAITSAAALYGVSVDASAFASYYDQGLAALEGVMLQNAPKYSATLAYQHTFDLSGGHRLAPRVEATYKDKYWSIGEINSNNSATLSDILGDTHNLYWQPSYLKWDAYTSWHDANDRYSVTGYVKNMTNKVIMTAYDGSVVQLAAPRTFGLTVSANF